MVFSSVTFVMFFLPITLLMYFIIYGFFHTPKHSMIWCNTFLLLVSLLFYAWGEPKYVVWLIFSMLLNFGVAFFLDLVKNQILRKVLFVLGIVFNLTLLCYFKYLYFFLQKGNALFAIFFPATINIDILKNIMLPLGISFYTFQGMSYIIDVYKKDVPATKNIIIFGCYLTMFPQLVAGPIVRYITIEQELRSRCLSIERTSQGITRFVIGLSKKVLIADTLGRVAEQAFIIPVEDFSLLVAWAGIICYSFQIYYDFSGYSDMAIGLGHIFGFTFPENFNYPYISKSVKEFWHRWHMTLSTWFRDYLYIPLGGNKCGHMRTMLNLFIVFALCGFWHGAASVFIIWGMYHGFFLILERLFPSFPGCLPTIFQHIYTLLVVSLGWVFFKATTVEHALGYIQKLFFASSPGVQANHIWMNFFSYDVYIALILATIGSTPIILYIKKYWNLLVLSKKSVIAIAAELLWLTIILSVFCICLMPLWGSTYTPFIYFRF